MKMASCCKSCPIVLIAVDGSEFSDRALHFYLKNLHKETTRVGLIHSYETPNIVVRAPMGIGKLDTDEIEKILRSSWDEADKIMEKCKKICQEYGVSDIEVFLENGRKPGEAICMVAKRENAVLIILGSRGQSRVRRSLLGSVSDYVVRHATDAATVVVP